MVMTTITLEDDKLVHIQRDCVKDKIVCIITREITPTGKLKATIDVGDVVSTRIFQRIIEVE